MKTSGMKTMKTGPWNKVLDLLVSMQDQAFQTESCRSATKNVAYAYRRGNLPVLGNNDSVKNMEILMTEEHKFVVK